MPIEEHNVTIRARGAELDGTVISPAEAGPYPGIVLVHGAGQRQASDLAGVAEDFARRGVVALVYDKSAEYSQLSHDFELLAEDALAAVRLLREHPQVGDEHVGLWGFSEGGWVVPIAAARAPDVVEFVVLASPPNVAPLRQAAWALDAALRRTDATHGVRTLMARRLAAGRFVDYVSYEPAPVLRRVTQPVLAVYGARDRIAPVTTSSQVLTSALDRGGNNGYTVRFFPDVGHALRAPGGALADGYVRTMVEWVTGLPATAEQPPERRVTGATPQQRYETPQVAETPWYAPGYVRYGALGLALMAYLVGPVTALVTRLRRRRAGGQQSPATSAETMRWRRRSRWLARSAITTYLMGFVASGIILALVLTRTEWTLAANGIWLLTRLLSVVTVVLAVAATYQVVSSVRTSWTLSTGERVSVFAAIGATGILAINFAYWGMFALSW